MAISLNDRDRLELDLHAPMLDEFMRSQQLKADLLAIGNEIKTGYVTRVPRDTGHLASTARVSMHRSKIFRDRRWEAQFEAGNASVDYALEVEEESHPLGETLVALGYVVGPGLQVGF